MNEPRTPTARSLQLLRRSGYVAAVTESWIPGANIRRDLFGFADVFAVSAHRDPPRLLIQATTAANMSARLKKAKGLVALRTCLAAGLSFEVWGWFRRGQTWEVRRVAVTGDDLQVVLVSPPRKRRRPSKQLELFA